MTTSRPGPVVFLDRYFYFCMSLLIAAIVIYGFSHTIDHNLIHAVPIRPWILTLHACVFSGWVVFYILQSALVRTHNVRIHRKLGWFGVALGVTMPVLGIWTALTMARFKIQHFHSKSAATFFLIPIMDILCFAVFFALAILWRRKPELHRRFIFIATCVLTSAAFARFPQLNLGLAYICLDGLIVLGVIRDLIVNHRVHQVYLYALPLLVIIQTFALYTFLNQSPWWVATAHHLVA